MDKVKIYFDKISYRPSLMRPDKELGCEIHIEGEEHLELVFYEGDTLTMTMPKNAEIERLQKEVEELRTELKEMNQLSSAPF